MVSGLCISISFRDQRRFLWLWFFFLHELFFRARSQFCFKYLSPVFKTRNTHASLNKLSQNLSSSPEKLLRRFLSSCWELGSHPEGFYTKQYEWICGLCYDVGTSDFHLKDAADYEIVWILTRNFYYIYTQNVYIPRDWAVWSGTVVWLRISESDRLSGMYSNARARSVRLCGLATKSVYLKFCKVLEDLYGTKGKNFTYRTRELHRVRKWKILIYDGAEVRSAYGKTLDVARMRNG